METDTPKIHEYAIKYPEPLHRRVRIAALKLGLTTNDLIVRLVGDNLPAVERQLTAMESASEAPTRNDNDEGAAALVALGYDRDESPELFGLAPKGGR